MDISKLFAAGGVVMYPLLLASILVVALAIERLYFWFKIGRRQQPLIQTVLDLYQHRSPLVIDRLDRDRDLPRVSSRDRRVHLCQPISRIISTPTRPNSSIHQSIRTTPPPSVGRQEGISG
jgi:biopolymer transport protein ExbB/TolQ